MAILQGNAGRLSTKRVVLAAAVVAALVLAIALITPVLVTTRIAARLRAEARRRQWTISWSDLRYMPPVGFRLRDLSVLAVDGDTLCRLASLDVSADPWAALTLHVRPRSVSLAHARLTVRPRVSAEADTLAPEEEETPRRRAHARDRSGRVRSQASELIRALLLPARDLPRLRLEDVQLVSTNEEAPSITLERLSLEPDRSGMRLRTSGTIQSEMRMPFELDLSYDDSDRLTGLARFDVSGEGGATEPLTFELSGRVHQDRRRGVVVIGDSTRVRVGRLPFRIGGRLERQGPHFQLRLDAADLTPDQVRASIPRPLLGPLTDVGVRGSFGYRASFDLDFARPDSVRFDADVIPHGLALDPRTNRLPLTTLAGPFTAEVHLPHGRVVAVDLFEQNPRFMPLDRMDTLLVGAVVTNEDGAFFRHRGFNTEAVKSSIAENIHAAAWRRGAGTITMQLARNLYLGHARTLSRKAQEVVLTWLIEHLAGLGKRRILEIYLNIIEWGPEVLGADEATHYYFGHDASRVTVPEALFLATLVPSPTRWRGRFAPDGTLRAYERAQMHFIGRAMIAKGWLAPDQLPTADQLGVELRGPAGELVRRETLPPPPDTLGVF